MVSVSVVIPVYNTGKYLDECIESVIKQSLKDIEILLVDDGSTDKSGDICDKYAENDSRIKVFHLENNGAASARNKGLENAKGEYLYFLDSDDMIEGNFLVTAYNIACANNSDLTICGERNYINADGNIISAIATYGIFVKHDFLKKHPDIRFPVGIQPSEDGIFSHKILALTSKISFWSLNHYFYRQHANQNSNSSVRKNNCINIINQIPEIFSVLEKFYDEHDLWEKNYYHLAMFIQNEIFFSRYKLVDFNSKESKKAFYLINDFFRKHLKKYLSKKDMRNFNSEFKQLVHSKNFEAFIFNRKLHKIEFIQDNFLVCKSLKSDLMNITKNFFRFLKKKKVSIKFVYFQERKFIRNFLKNISPERILVVEMNDFHNEVIPGYLKYLYDLGYECDVLITSLIYKENVFFNVPSRLYKNLYNVRYFIIQKLLQSPEIRKYHKILITSNYVYLPNCVLTDYKNLQDKNKIIFVDHNIKYVTQKTLSEHKILCLNNFKRDDLCKNVVNPHYFGNIKITSKNDVTKFLIVGRIKDERQNYRLITETIEKLKLKNIFNYKITIVGYDLGGQYEKLLTNEINLEYKGRLDFEKMYKEVEKADFLLNLFDETNPKHKVYTENVTSGQMQLSYGFLKPVIIQKSFAPYYGFDEANSLLYENDSDFANIFEHAISMSNDEYRFMQNNLSEYTKQLYVDSLNNLSNILI